MKRPLPLAALCAALLFSALAPALLLGSSARSMVLAFPVFLIALGHSVVLGLPIFLVLRWKGWVNAATSVLCGFAVGAIPIGVAMLPVGYSESTNTWIGPERPPTIVDGKATIAQWLLHLEMIGLLGALGGFAGFVFWLVLKLAQRTAPPGRKVQPSWRFSRLMSRQSVLLSAAVLLSGVVLAVPSLMTDNSCHNLTRNGRSSVAPEVSMNLAIGTADWPKLASVFERFGAVHGMSFRNDSRQSKTVSVLALSLCTESGLNILALEQRWAVYDFEPAADGMDMRIGIYVLQNETEWRPLARRLVSELESAWPGGVEFKAASGKRIAKPAVLTEAE